MSRKYLSSIGNYPETSSASEEAPKRHEAR